jgi:GNAT superfamily N-acetyltransferase
MTIACDHLTDFPTTGQPDPDVRNRLDAHFLRWLGAIPDPDRPQLVITSLREEAGWDGKVRPIQGVTGPEGSVLAVSPTFADLFASVNVLDVFADAASRDGSRRMANRLGVPVGFGMPVFRWSEQVPDLKDAGEWISPGDSRMPDWLKPFNGGVLIAFDKHGAYRAGVGLKRHNDLAREISVGTEPSSRGRGLATRLVAQAARRIIDEGGVPIYQHGGGNEPSARAAVSAGFPDRGWHMLEINPGASGDIRG